MKVAIVSMLSNVSKSPNHHGGGYANIMVQILRDYHRDHEFDVNPDPKDWGSYEKLFFSEGVNFQGKPIAQIGDQIIRVQDKISYNVPGGPQSEHREKIKAVLEYKGEIVLVNNLFDFSEFARRMKITSDIWPETKYKNYAIDYGKVNRRAVIGDSHSLSVWKPGFGLDRIDGRTLWNFINTSKPEEINEAYDETITYFGNIDLRFHLMRQPDPKSATVELFKRYLDFNSKLKNNTIVELLPVEHESRKLPGTGLYKGEKYFGTRDERMELRATANSILKSSGMKIYSWPSKWEEGDGTKMFEVMEPRQSVHLKPLFYYHNLKNN
jgi:hypothetical protein